MAKFKFLFLILAVGVLNVTSKPEYLGRLRNPVPSSNDSMLESDYYVDRNTATWADALSVCRALDFDGLVSIDTPEEWEGIKNLMEAFGPGQIFWMGSEYDGADWRWEHNGEMIPKPDDAGVWPPWDLGFPINNFVHRGTIFFLNRFNSKWRTAVESSLHVFICEQLLDETVPVPCYNSNDLIILLDSSSSVGLESFEIAKDFVARLAMAYLVHPGNRVGILRFSSNALIVLELGAGTSPSAINDTIYNIPYDAGNTNTGEAIMEGSAMFGRNPRDVVKNMLIVTDGMSNDPAATKRAAEAAISNGIRTHSLGVTLNVNPEELLEITGGVVERVFTTEDFDKLLNLLRPVSLKMCEK